jgi:hypothetical protein
VFDYPAIAVGVVAFDLVGGSGYAKQEAFWEGIGGGWSGARRGPWRRVGRFMTLLTI